jgi:hypothetical protein
VKHLPALVLSAAVASAVVAVPATAQEGDGALAPRVTHFAQAQTLGFYRGKTVEYLDLGMVKLRGGNKLAPIWAFANGAPGQFNIIDTVPGQAVYSPLWSVRLVTWKDGVAPRLLRSRSAVEGAVRAGQATVKAMPIVVNCPVL